MPRNYKRLLMRIIYFVITCGCVYATAKFFLVDAGDRTRHVSDIENLHQLIVSNLIKIYDIISFFQFLKCNL